MCLRSSASLIGWLLPRLITRKCTEMNRFTPATGPRSVAVALPVHEFLFIRFAPTRASKSRRGPASASNAIYSSIIVNVMLLR